LVEVADSVHLELAQLVRQLAEEQLAQRHAHVQPSL
jgi:hypothetical protein